MKTAGFAIFAAGCFLFMPSYVFAVFEVSKAYQPDFQNPRQYTSEEMKQMAQQVLNKVSKKLGTRFNQRDPQHVMQLAEFFRLTPDDHLDFYSEPMEDADVRYFSEIDQFQEKELYPRNPVQLAIRFYWEGLARIAAEHFRLEVVNNVQGKDYRKSRGKISDVATTAMFDKRPGISVAEAVEQDRERYDVAKLIKHLKAKGRPANRFNEE